MEGVYLLFIYTFSRGFFSIFSTEASGSSGKDEIIFRSQHWRRVTAVEYLVSLADKEDSRMGAAEGGGGVYW